MNPCDWRIGGGARARTRAVLPGEVQPSDYLDVGVIARVFPVRAVGVPLKEWAASGGGLRHLRQTKETNSIASLGSRLRHLSEMKGDIRTSYWGAISEWALPTAARQVDWARGGLEWTTDTMLCRDPKGSM